jgi:ubiquinone/menaquinone biosynthesis C-methylase UbiE
MPEGPAHHHAFDAKRAAIEQWTADPIASNLAVGEPGTRPYFESLVQARAEYAPWMAEVLGYAPGSEDVARLDVLDVGCGSGIDLAGYARAGAHVTGIDLTPRHVELARRHLDAMGLSGEVREGDAETLPFDDASFDRVSSNGVLHHTPDMPATLREIVRVLRPGGEARILVYNKRSLHYWVNQVLMSGIMQRALLEERSMANVLSRNVEYSSIGARPLVRVYNPGRLRKMMRAAGFSDVSTQVRGFKTTDAFLVYTLSRRFPRLRDPDVNDRIGRVAGWYVIATAGKP